MGVAIDTVLVDVHNAATTAGALAAGTAATGDSLGIRYYKTGKAWLVNVMQQVTTPPQQVRITSPRLHDNVTGLTFWPLENPSEFLFPSDWGQEVYPNDTLSVSMTTAASSDSVAALEIYYQDLQGVQAELKTWDEIKTKIINIKPTEIDVTTSGTIGAWQDTVITTTENQLKANYNYACLGFTASANLLTVGLKGPDTGNLRICCPAASPTLRLTDYFVFMSQQLKLPFIPIFNANNRASTYISSAANTASVASKVTAIFAQLSD